MGIIIIPKNEVLDIQMGNSIRGGFVVDIHLAHTWTPFALGTLFLETGVVRGEVCDALVLVPWWVCT